MKNAGTFTLALLTWETPETVVGFARLVECGYYNGLTFHRVEPNFVIQGGSPGANEYAGYPYFMLDEVGLASNRRGTVGLSTRGRNTGDAQWYVNLVDNARLDHNYTVFATVVSGMDVVDAILEGDEIAEIKLVTPISPRVLMHSLSPIGGL
jgi:cyclophilin family peptidyl-prolyl cis-trans isomerase